MLNSLRKHTAGWAAKILIGLLVIAFALWGVSDLFNPSQNRTIITMADDKITTQDLQRYEVELSILRRVRMEQVRAARRLVIPLLVSDRMVDKHADQLSLGVAQEVIHKEIIQDRSFADITGKFSKDTVRRFLESRGISEQFYLDILMKGNIRGQLVSIITNDVKAPKAIVEAKHKYDNEARVLQYVLFDKKAIKKIEAPEEQVLKDYYEKNKARFKNPELRKVAYIYLTTERLKDGIKIDDKQIEKAYNSLKNKYTKPERRQLQQISFSDIKKAEAAHKKLTEGAKFEDIAKENNQKAADIELGNITKKDILDKDVAEKAFSTKKGAFTKPLKGSLNTVIIKVVDITPGQVTPLKDVSKELSDKLALEKAAAKITTLQKAIEDDRGEGTLLKDIAKKYKLKYEEVDISRQATGNDGKKVKGFPASPSLLKEIFESDIGIDNEMITIGSRNNSVWFDILKITGERTRTFEEVKKEAEALWIAAEEQKALDAKAKETLEALKKGEKLDVVSKTVSSKVVTSKALKRKEVDKDLPATIVRQAFSLPLNKPASASTAGGSSRILFLVSEIKQAKDLDEKKRKSLEAVLVQNFANDMLSQYLGGLRSQYGVNILPQAYR